LFALSRAQTPAIDSLAALIKVDKENADKVSHLVKLCWHCNMLGEYDRGETYGKEAVALAKKLKLPKNEEEALNNLGVTYYSMGKYPEALDNYFSAYKIAKNIGDVHDQASLLSNIGVLYDEQENYDKALDYYNQSQELAVKEKNKPLIASNYNNIGSVYLKRKDNNTALDFYLKSLKLKQEIGNKRSISNSLLNIGNVYFGIKDFPKALKYFMGALKLKEEINDESGTTILYGNIGTVYTEMDEYNRAEDYLKRSLQKAEEIKSLDDISNGHFNLSSLYREKKNFEQALFHFTEYKRLEDSISDDSKVQDIARLEAKHEFDVQQAVLDAEHKKEIELGAEREKRQKYVTYSIAAGLLLVLLFAIFIFNRFKITNKQKAIIEHQKVIVENKQKETMDSIRYAQRIQQSILPSDKYIEKTFERLKE
jgi:tetratricopeptide (TPR) repeat protein